MTITFKYARINRPDGTLKHAPYIPITILNANDKPIRVIALIDSGADTSVISKSLSELLGLTESETETETKGIGGNVRVKKAHLRFKIGSLREKYTLSIQVLVLQDKNQDIPPLLGRSGLFEQFAITFKQLEEKIIFKKVNPKKRY